MGDLWIGSEPLNSATAAERCPDASRYLNQLGAEGWEHVSATPSSAVQRESGITQIVTCLFLRRPLA